MKAFVLALSIEVIAVLSVHAASPNLVPYKRSSWDNRPIVMVTYDDGDARGSWAVTNAGNKDVTKYFYTKLYVDGEYIERWKTDSLKKGKYVSQSFNLGKLTTGNHTVKIVTDSSDRVDESKESDNSYTLTFKIEDEDVLTWPLPSDYTQYSQSFGEKWSANPSKKHTGLDLPAPKGTKVYAAKSGRVSRKGDLGNGWGTYVIVSHDNNTWTTCYLHVRHSLSVGDTVSEGDKIGTVYLDHLHFGIRKAPTSAISPKGALPASSGADDPKFPEYFVDPRDYDFETEN